MNHACLKLLLIASVFVAGAPGPANAELENMFFLHHSVGRYIIEDSDLRGLFADFDSDHGTAIRFWDHDYLHIGLANPEGELLGYHYGAAASDTDPDGLHHLWTTTSQPAARDSILYNHDVIAFKSCYSGSDIVSDALFAQWQFYYTEILQVLVQHPDKRFLLLTSPPRNRRHAMGEPAIAARARAMASWLTSPEYAGDAANVFVFDLFDVLAEPDDGQPGANTLRSEYERNSGTDSHPNTLANTIVGPLLADFFTESAGLGEVVSSALPAPLKPSIRTHPNPFNPQTSIVFELNQPEAVSLTIFDLRGRLVCAIFAEQFVAAGRHEHIWNGRDQQGRTAPSGVYLCRLQTASAASAVKITLAE